MHHSGAPTRISVLLEMELVFHSDGTQKCPSDPAGTTRSPLDTLRGTSPSSAAIVSWYIGGHSHLKDFVEVVHFFNYLLRLSFG